MDVDIPAEFDARFLTWFRARTESFWAAMPELSSEQVLAKFMASGAGGCEWQRGAHWLGGLSEQDIARVERSQHLALPPDYRLFVQLLHATDKPMLCAGYLEPGAHIEDQTNLLASAYVESYQQYMVLEASAGFHNWLLDAGDPRMQLEALSHGILFDVEHNDLWPAAWGAKPSTSRAREERVRAMVEAAPKLIPVYGSRYLLAEPSVAGNPILSIDQADIVVYGANLREYLLLEFADMLGFPRWTIEQPALKALAARREIYKAIPFWGSLCAL